jgi:hypothetical protein
MYITNKKAIQITKEIVAKEAPMILERLGLDNEDGILERIIVEDFEMPANFGTHEAKYIKDYFGVYQPHELYKQGTAVITLYPLSMMHLWFRTSDSTYRTATNWRMRLSKKAFKRRVINTLAHELRHYWQIKTGRIFQEKSVFMMNFNFTPYLDRWEEKDANKFADQYLEGHRL